MRPLLLPYALMLALGPFLVSSASADPGFVKKRSLDLGSVLEERSPNPDSIEKRWNKRSDCRFRCAACVALCYVYEAVRADSVTKELSR
jgi:hypothetical protein